MQATAGGSDADDDPGTEWDEIGPLGWDVLGSLRKATRRIERRLDGVLAV